MTSMQMSSTILILPTPKRMLEMILINLIDKNQHDEILLLVDQILIAKKLLQQAKTKSDKNYLQRKRDIIERQIDELVYQLYGLTEEEIKILEGG